MPKNIIGGKGFKKGKKIDFTVARKFPTKKELENDSNEELFLYAHVEAVLGGKNVSLKSLTNKNLLGIIRGNMYKKVWLNKGDLVLCSKRINLKDNKCDIIFKYNSDEVRTLKKLKEILPEINVSDTTITNEIFNNENEMEKNNKIDNEIDNQTDSESLDIDII